jgi:UDP-glucose 4-epimerase
MQRIKTANLGKILITGGTGFVGSNLIKRLVDGGVSVRILDNNSRGMVRRLEGYLEKVDYREGDVTDFNQVYQACKGIDTLFHLAFINGTENFYRIPERVLEVGVKGALNTLDAAMRCGVSNYLVTSSSEVYQEPSHIPTSEEERLIIPDVKNPRFSYSGGKIITELLAIHYTAKTGLRTVICRPHNFYGPDMGVAHVIPQFILRMKTLSDNFRRKEIDFPIQGTGEETRSFCYIDDAVEGILLCAILGKSREIYHIGTEDEITIAGLAKEIAGLLEFKINIIPGKRLPGGTTRRCPSIAKIRSLGYEPQTSLRKGLIKTTDWYTDDTTPRYEGNDEEIIR